MCIPTITFQKFYNENNAKFNGFAFLFGNGFLKSSPQLDKIGKNCFDILDAEYKTIWHTVNSRVTSFITLNKLRPKEKICPEELLNYIRLVYGIEIFKLYLQKQKFLADKSIPRPTEFLKKFNAIYTLNYDLYSYVCQFECRKKDYHFSDGFSNMPIELEDIKERQRKSGKIPYYYVHGAFHIFQTPCCEQYEKIVSNGKIEDFPEKIIEKYNEIDAKLYECRPGINILDELDDPIIVLSGKSTYKDAAVSEDLYLEYCLLCLSNENKIFTFGCSFKRDKHILKKLLFSNGSQKKDIYIGYYTNSEKRNIENCIEEYFEKNKKNRSKVTFVNISENPPYPSLF